MTVGEDKLRPLGPWPQGLNNVAQDTEVPPTALRKAFNVDLTDQGKPRRRKGRTSVYSGTNIRSLYDVSGFTVFAEGADFQRIFPDNSVVTLFSGLDENNPLSYAEVNTELFFTDGDNNFKSTLGGVVTPLSVPNPNTRPALAEVADGGLDAGLYQVTCTHVDQYGTESGTDIPALLIEVAEGSRIVVSGLSLPPNAVATNVYVTKANGETLYHYAQTDASSVSIFKQALGKKLETQFMSPMPAGQVMFYYKGRLWVAQGNVLWFSEPLRYGLTKLSSNFIMFPERITIGQPVLDGIYIVSDRTYFLAGTNPKQMQQVVVSPDRAVEGTGMLLKPDVFNVEDVVEDTAYWFGTRGAMLGLPGGRVTGLMEDRVAVPDYQKGATLYRADGGIQQMITAVSNPGEVNSLRLGDTASAEVIRNGILIS